MLGIRNLFLLIRWYLNKRTGKFLLKLDIKIHKLRICLKFRSKKKLDKSYKKLHYGGNSIQVNNFINVGFYDEAGNHIQKQLDIAAQDVGIAKKTLDDYLLQIRNGKKYGFDFNNKSSHKIG